MVATRKSGGRSERFGPPVWCPWRTPGGSSHGARVGSTQGTPEGSPRETRAGGADGRTPEGSSPPSPALSAPGRKQQQWVCLGHDVESPPGGITHDRWRRTATGALIVTCREGQASAPGELVKTTTSAPFIAPLGQSECPHTPARVKTSPLQRKGVRGVPRFFQLPTRPDPALAWWLFS